MGLALAELTVPGSWKVKHRGTVTDLSTVGMKAWGALDQRMPPPSPKAEYREAENDMEGLAGGVDTDTTWFKTFTVTQSSLIKNGFT